MKFLTTFIALTLAGVAMAETPKADANAPGYGAAPAETAPVAVSPAGTPPPVVSPAGTPPPAESAPGYGAPTGVSPAGTPPFEEVNDPTAPYCDEVVPGYGSIGNSTLPGNGTDASNSTAPAEASPLPDAGASSPVASVETPVDGSSQAASTSGAESLGLSSAVGAMVMGAALMLA